MKSSIKPINEFDYGDQDIPEIDTVPYQNGSVVGTEPLPESSRERKDGPGGE